MALIGTRKKTIHKKRHRGKWPRLLAWVKRFGMVLMIGVFVLWLCAWLYWSGSFARAGHWGKQQILTVSADMGFAVEDILVEGRVHADPDVLRALINVQKGDPLFSFNPAEAQRLVKRIAWIRAAHIERRLPGTIYIRLEERRPLALFQRDKTLSLIDEKGDVITKEGLDRFKGLIIVMGPGAPQQAPALFKNLGAEPLLLKRARSAKWIDRRRWDLRFEKDILVKMPESDLGLALRRLAVAQDEDALLDKDIISLDLREPDRIVVRTRPGAVQDYKSGFRAGVKTGNNI